MIAPHRRCRWRWLAAAFTARASERRNFASDAALEEADQQMPARLKQGRRMRNFAALAANTGCVLARRFRRQRRDGYRRSPDAHRSMLSAHTPTRGSHFARLNIAFAFCASFD
jgi:hypothetical protein